MTVALASEVEARLQTFAKEFDLDSEQLAADLLTSAFNDLKETMDGLDRSVEDYNAGRWITSEEHGRRMKASVAEARARRNGLIAAG